MPYSSKVCAKTSKVQAYRTGETYRNKQDRLIRHCAPSRIVTFSRVRRYIISKYK
jgi:hypothetical protein